MPLTGRLAPAPAPCTRTEHCKSVTTALSESACFSRQQLSCSSWHAAAIAARCTPPPRTYGLDRAHVERAAAVHGALGVTGREVGRHLQLIQHLLQCTGTKICYLRGWHVTVGIGAGRLVKAVAAAAARPHAFCSVCPHELRGAAAPGRPPAGAMYPWQ